MSYDDGVFQTSTNVSGTVRATTAVTTLMAVSSAPVMKDTSCTEQLTVQVMVLEYSQIGSAGRETVCHSGTSSYYLKVYHYFLSDKYHSGVRPGSKPNSITLSWSPTGPRLVADLSLTC